MDTANMEAKDTTSSNLQLRSVATGNEMSGLEQLSSGRAFGNPAFDFSGPNPSNSLGAGPASPENLTTDSLRNEESEPIDVHTSSVVLAVDDEEAVEEDTNSDDFEEQNTEIPVAGAESGPFADDSRASALAEIYRLARLLDVEIIEPPNELGNPALFLEKLPLEIRQMVYELLLVNPIQSMI
ncbi:hypothetical protein IFR05_009111 [Cadophora sp. M221]|nr:hypothetical protein IFR05_009111 [Cadophora sp. M221]